MIYPELFGTSSEVNQKYQKLKILSFEFLFPIIKMAF